MENKRKKVYEPNGKSVKEYAYLEDKNYPNRKTMEDSTLFLIQTTLLSMGSPMKSKKSRLDQSSIQASSPSLMAMGDLTLLIVALK